VVARTQATPARRAIAPPIGVITSGSTISPTSRTAMPIAKLAGHMPPPVGFVFSAVDISGLLRVWVIGHPRCGPEVVVDLRSSSLPFKSRKPVGLRGERRPWPRTASSRTPCNDASKDRARYVVCSSTKPIDRLPA